jgi:hypothetical protein
MAEVRVGNWTQTYTGKQFFPMDPRPEEVFIVDVAHALSQICRFGGHTSKLYSVGQHSVLVARKVLEVDPENAFTALLHDAQEAYIGDMVNPLKKSQAEYREVEQRLWEVIAEKWDLPFELPQSVMEADLRMCATEARSLLRWPPPADWSLSHVEPYPDTIIPWEPPAAELEFLRMFHILESAR